AVADAIGQRLSRLATRAQVLAVTHAPQVAARAGRHLHIRKGALAKSLTKEPSVVTRVAVLDEMQRREEIARMLSGAAITDEARAAAAQLIKNSK
ncbi:MAG: DNA repair protein RecN, partial [Methylocystis sp.]